MLKTASLSKRRRVGGGRPFHGPGVCPHPEGHGRKPLGSEAARCGGSSGGNARRHGCGCAVSGDPRWFEPVVGSRAKGHRSGSLLSAAPRGRSGVTGAGEKHETLIERQDAAEIARVCEAAKAGGHAADGARMRRFGDSPPIAQTIMELGTDVGAVKSVATLGEALADFFRQGSGREGAP
jgi:hypothetical protein